MISSSSPYILFYSFIVSLIVYNSEFVHTFSIQSNRYRFISRAQFLTIPRSQVTQIFSDSDDYNSGEESDSKVFDDDLDEEILDDENIEVEDDDDDEEETEGDEVGEGDGLVANSWQERRQTMNAERDKKAAAIRAKLSWEEKFEDDPLRADNPTKALEEEVEPYEKMFVVVGDVGSEMLSMRSKAWVHHMQWVRRSALLPDIEAKVKWEYTRLSHDSMGPVGQVIGIKANTSAEVRALLETEPLSVVGGVSPWKVFEFNQVKHENTTWELHDPRMFLGFDVEGSSKSSDQYEKLAEKHDDYHIAGGRLSTIDPVMTAYKGETVMQQHPIMNHKRAVLVGRLISCDEDSTAVNGTLVLFNAKTNADAERYISLDPLMQAKGVYDKKKSFISPVNQQDVDGLHHMMARTFGEKTVLDQVGFVFLRTFFIFIFIPLAAHYIAHA